MKYIFFFLLIIGWAVISRLLWIGSIPYGLYTDEANQLYNAQSVWETGKDEHGTSYPVSFRSFGDWKPPLQTYLMIPFVAMRMTPEASARLPGVISGIMTIAISIVFVEKALLLSRKSSLLMGYLLAVSPWHILQSRSAMLVAPTLLFLLIGVYSMLVSKKYRWAMFTVVLSFSLAVYGYYAMRVVVPLFCVYWVVRGWQWIWRYKTTYVALALGCVMMFPLLSAFITQPDVVLGRAKTVSIFYDQGIRLRQWELITQEPEYLSTSMTRMMHNAGYLFLRDIARRFFSHMDLWYLFVVGDTVQPFQISGMGLFYIPEVIFLGVGIWYWSNRKKDSIVYVWFIISTIPASLTFLTPSSNRTFFSIIPILVLCCVGLSYISKKKRWLTACVVPIMYIGCIGYFFHQYMIVMPRDYPMWWNGGWKETVSYVQHYEQSYETIIVADHGGMPYIYFLLYGNIDPHAYQTDAVRTYKADEFGFEHVDQYHQYYFPRDITWSDVKDQHLSHAMYIFPANEIPDTVQVSHVIYYPSGVPMVKIISYD